MSQWLIVLLSFIFVFGTLAAYSSGDMTDDATAYVRPFYGMQKKWSRREPSIRFFKRNGQMPQISPFMLDN